jgi:hypothetical protein
VSRGFRAAHGAPQSELDSAVRTSIHDTSIEGHSRVAPSAPPSERRNSGWGNAVGSRVADCALQSELIDAHALSHIDLRVADCALQSELALLHAGVDRRSRVAHFVLQSEPCEQGIRNATSSCVAHLRYSRK